jgi:hypothetical protein
MEAVALLVALAIVAVAAFGGRLEHRQRTPRRVIRTVDVALPAVPVKLDRGPYADAPDARNAAVKNRRGRRSLRPQADRGLRAFDAHGPCSACRSRWRTTMPVVGPPRLAAGLPRDQDHHADRAAGRERPGAVRTVIATPEDPTTSDIARGREDHRSPEHPSRRNRAEAAMRPGRRSHLVCGLMPGGVRCEKWSRGQSDARGRLTWSGVSGAYETNHEHR